MAPAKAKAQKMSIGSFLTNENFGSWADEMDELPAPVPAPEPRSGYGSERRSYTSAGGFGMNHVDREPRFHREELPLPTEPPFTAHIGNLSFDATQEDISLLFADCQVTNVRIVEDKMTRAPKGFGYVEFGTLDGLKKALTFQGASLQGRNIRVSVAEPPKERHETRDFSDWTRKGPLPDLPNQRRVSDRPGFGSNMSDAGSEFGGRRGYEPADGKVRDFSNWERKGPLSPSLPPPQLGREGGRPRSKDGPQFRRASPAWGEGRSQDGSRPPRREYTERPPPPPTAAEMDNQWRARMRPDPPKTTAPPPEANVPPQAAAPPAPAVRPKLNLQKRTVPESDQNASPTAPESKASIFGGAKPIDSAAREREVEEKRTVALRQKKEAEEKEKAERAEKERLAKEQELQAKQQQAKAGAEGANGAKDDASGVPQGAKNFEILRRMGEEEQGAESESATETPQGEPASEAKPAAPKEPVRPQPPSQANGSWRNGGPRSRGPSASHRGGPPRGPAQGHGKGQYRGGPPPAPAATTPVEPEEEGWSTVGPSSRQRSNRRGRY